MTPVDPPRPRVAVVAYFFPPLGGIAVARALGLVKYLPAAGWEPVVIAPEGSPYVLRDPAGTASIPTGTEVVRGLSPEPTHLSGLVRRGLEFVRATRTPAATDPVTAPAAPPPSVPAPAAPATAAASESAAAGSSIQRRLVSLLRTLIWFPDDQVGWLPFAVLAIVRAHRRAPLAAVVSTSSPITSHLAAGIARRILGIAWIADFRDPWLDNPIEPPPGRLTQWRRQVVESWIVRSADRCTFATPSLAETYRRRYPRAAGRLDLVPNGYDRGELGEPAAAGGSKRRARSRKVVRLVYAGSLYRPAELDAFLLGVRRLMAERDVTDRLRVEFVGTMTEGSRAVADAHLADEPDLATIVAFHGFVPREEALRRIAEADAALTLLGSGPGMEMFVGAKLFDYIGLDRPVLAVVPPGDARGLLADLGWGIVADPTPEGVAAGLAQLVDDPAAAGRTGRADPEGRYDRRRTAASMAELLRCAVDGADPRAAGGATAR
jgi:glycosyltransferase involved in cell wall biosynthesis